LQLALSLLVLAFAPLLGIAAAKLRKRVAQALLVVMVLLVMLQIMPETVAVLGPMAVVLALTGWAGPTLFERWQHAHGVHALPRGLVAAGLVGHALLDGAALGTESVGLGWAVVLHRIPAATATWMVLQPCWGGGRTSLVLVATGLSTLAGWWGGHGLVEAHEGPLVAAFIALVAGSLLHLATHQLDHDHHHH
jgi:hypothetical protein